ncbi:hypothetical protein ACMAZF_07185 [Psychrobium sp. nBUS_13]
MNDLYTQAATIFLGFFAIMNPIANTAVFSGLAGRLKRHFSQLYFHLL